MFHLAQRGVNAQASLLMGTMVQEHERAAGSWQAEWPAMTEALRLTGGTAFAVVAANQVNSKSIVDGQVKEELPTEC